MLRGDLKAARTKFLKAYERDPNNPTVVNNLKLLNESAVYPARPRKVIDELRWTPLPCKVIEMSSTSASIDGRT
jgi:Flp pilus assembly protein TadD